MAGWAGYVFTGGPRRVQVPAAYTRLDGCSVAVMVAADDHLLHRHPNAPALVARAVVGRIGEDVPTAALLDPRQIDAYVSQDPFWTTRSYGELLRRLGAQRLVLVDLSEYTTRNVAHGQMWQGALAASVSVAEAEQEHEDDVAYRTSLGVVYPDQPVALLDGDGETVELGMLKIFAAEVSALFHDHEELVN